MSAAVNLAADGARSLQTIRPDTIASLCGGDSHVALVANDDSLWVLGDNSYGQLGIGQHLPRTDTFMVSIPSGVRAVSCGLRHTVVLMKDGRLLATGDNLVGQCGINGYQKIYTFQPLDVRTGEENEQGARFNLVACGHRHTLAVSTDGVLWGTGDNSAGQLYPDPADVNLFTLTRLPLPQRGQVTAIEAGATFSAAIVASSTVVYSTSLLSGPSRQQPLRRWLSAVKMSPRFHCTPDSTLWASPNGFGLLTRDHRGTATIQTLYHSASGLSYRRFESDLQDLTSIGTMADAGDPPMSTLLLIGKRGQSNHVQALHVHHRAPDTQFLLTDVPVFSNGAATPVIAGRGCLHALYVVSVPQRVHAPHRLHLFTTDRSLQGRLLPMRLWNLQFFFTELSAEVQGGTRAPGRWGPPPAAPAAPAVTGAHTAQSASRAEQARQPLDTEAVAVDIPTPAVVDYTSLACCLQTTEDLSLFLRRIKLAQLAKELLTADGLLEADTSTHEALYRKDRQLQAPRRLAQYTELHMIYLKERERAVRVATIDSIQARRKAAREALGAAHETISAATACLLSTPGQAAPLRTAAKAALEMFKAEQAYTAACIVPPPPGLAPTWIHTLPDAELALTPTGPDLDFFKVLRDAQNVSMVAVYNAARGAANRSRYNNAIAYISLLTDSILADCERIDEEEPVRMQLLQQSADETRVWLASIRAEEALADEVERLKGRWPALQEAVKAANVAAAKLRSEIALLEAHEDVPSEEQMQSLEAKLDKAAQARAAVETARARVREIASTGLPEATLLLQDMQPAVKVAHKTEFERLWADLLAEGVAMPYTMADYPDRVMLDHSYCTVYRARFRGSGEIVVLKVFPKLPTDLKLFMNEIRMLRRLQHPNVIALEAVLQDTQFVYLHLPLIAGGNLSQWLVSQGRRSVEDRLAVFQGIVQGLAYVHSRGVVHRDLKPANIFITADGTPKIGDFGVSMASDPSSRLGPGGMTTVATAGLGRNAGTVAYKSPEQLRGERASSSSDMYALGLLLYELLYGVPYPVPVEERTGEGGAILPAQARGETPQAVIDIAQPLLQRLLSPTASDRPLAAAVLADPLCDARHFTSPLPSPGVGTEETQQGNDGRVLAVARRLTQYLRSAALRRIQHRVPTGPDLVPALTHVLHAACAPTGEAAGFQDAPWRLDLMVDDGVVETERVLDMYIASAMRPAARLFTTHVRPEDEAVVENSSGQGTVLPHPITEGGATEEGLFAFGAALAQAALQSATALDALPRLPPLFLSILVHGVQPVLKASFTTLANALACLTQWDADLARQYRRIVDGKAEEYGIELKNWQGVPESVKDGNKVDVLRRACQHICMDSRYSAWEAVRRGWLAGGGSIVLQAMSAEGCETLRPLLYDPGAQERRVRNREEDRAGAAAVLQITKPCPHCGVRIFKDGGCDHMHCRRCGTHFNWSGTQYHPPPW